jgi:hypothetical protein
MALAAGIGVPERVVRGLLAKIVSGWGLWRGRVGEIGWEESTTQRVQAAIDERVNLLYSE